jgi:hypothetical protein
MSTVEALIHPMLICEMNNMRNFTSHAIMASLRKNNVLSLFFNSIFTNFLKNKSMLIRLLAIKFSSLRLTFFNFMLALLAI